ncbi:MAG: hypothetical protein NTX50_03845 [Candidatus Sumerlaeota bacterium]|nr:hypothetical protein [Candidatus Sumerlaeota bacterium]
MADARAQRLTEAVALVAGFEAAQVFRSNGNRWDEMKRALPDGNVFSIAARLPESERSALAPACEELRTILAASGGIEDALIDIFESCEAMRAGGNPDEPELAFDAEALKSQGAFFTPASVAEGVVDNALAPRTAQTGYLSAQTGSLIAPTESLIAQSESLPRIFDPAMGAGRFLIKAFQRLTALYPEAARDPVRVAQSALFGVERNPVAVDFARACLRLIVARAKAARGHGDPLSDLPDMSGNLIHGDSLAPAPQPQPQTMPDDLFSAIEISPACESGMSGVDWQRAFPAIFGPKSARGFDIVVANPPYCFGEQLDATLKEYYARAYRCAQDQYDTYGMFLEAAVTRWLRPGGRYAFLVPDALLVRELTAPVREILIREGGIETCEHLGDVFESMEFRKGAPKKVGVSVVLISGIRAPYDPERRLRRIDDLRLTNDDSRLPIDDSRFTIDDSQSSIVNPQTSIVNRLGGLRHSDILRDPLRRFFIYFEDEEFPRYQALAAAGVTVADLLAPQGIGRGEETGKKHLASQASETCAIPIVAGEAVGPFRIRPERRYVAQLLPRKLKYYEWSPKIMVVKTGRRLVAARDDERLACLQSVYCLCPRDERSAALLEAWLNSDRCAWLVEKTITAYKKLMPQITQAELLALPVPEMDAATVDKLLALIQRLHSADIIESDREKTIRKINSSFG